MSCNHNAGMMVLIVVLLGGCATTSTFNLYPGPEKSADEVATVLVPWQVQVRSANGEKDKGSLFGGSEKESSYRVLPGPQDWRVRYYDPFADDRPSRNQDRIVDRTEAVPLRFNAEAGRTYRVRFETSEQNPALRNVSQPVRFWVTEESASGSQPMPVQPDNMSAKPEVASSATPSASTTAPAPVTLEKAALEQLKSWWNVAGSMERKAFLDWIHEER
jgi:hypothetical protein